MRNGTLDHARLAAAAGIVLFHSGVPALAPGHAALPFFLMLLVLLGWTGAATTPFAAHARGRIERLMRPWALWSAVYAGLKIAEAQLAGRPLASEFAPWMLGAGPAIHLWFLPFATVVGLALWPLARLAAGKGQAWRGTVAVGLVAGAALVLAAQAGPALPRPVAQWAFGLPAVLLGLGLVLVPGAAGRAGVLVVAGALFAGAGWPQGAGLVLLAGAALWLCLLVRLPAGPVSAGAARLSLTVYLAHPALASLLQRTGLLPDRSVALALATLALALGVALLIDRLQQRGLPALALRRRAPSAS